MTNPPTGNLTFAAHYKRFGFRKLKVNEKLRIGDLVQVPGVNGPGHAMLITNFDKTGKPLYSYSDGFGIYKRNATYPSVNGYIYYRYIGTDDERKQIEEHNAQVAEEQEIIHPAAIDTLLRPYFDISPVPLPILKIRK